MQKLDLWLKPYEIIGTGTRAGIIGVCMDALSIDSIKKKMGGKNSQIIHYFKQQFGGSRSKAFKQARQNFCKSLAAYSLLCYILQIKDRHNANILINMINGNLVHIDFGFILSSRMVNFERAPFKITNDII